MKTTIGAILLLALLTLVGCEGAAPAPATTAEEPIAGLAPPAPEPRAGERPPGGEPTAVEPTADTATSPQPAPGEEVGTSEKAAVGVGAKGRDYGGEGFVTTPVETFFRTGDRIVFEAQIPKNLQLYKAEHDNKGPKNHDEFMKAIIVDGGVSLPELPEGDTYWYDAKTETLMVRHPADK